MNWETVARQVSIRTYTTLKAGGNAEYFAVAKTSEELRRIAEGCQSHGIHLTPIGTGSNVLPSDAGVPGMVAINLTSSISFGPDGSVTCDSGVGFQELYLQAAIQNSSTMTVGNINANESANSPHPLLPAAFSRTSSAKSCRNPSTDSPKECERTRSSPLVS